MTPLCAQAQAPFTPRSLAASCLAAASLLLSPPGQAQAQAQAQAPIPAEDPSVQQTLPLALSDTPANTNPLPTALLGVSVSADGKRLTVKTKAVQGAAGGPMTFGRYPC